MGPRGGLDLRENTILVRSYTLLRVLDCIVTILFGCIRYCGCLNLFCNVCVCVCVGFLMCGCVYVWVCVCVCMCGCVCVCVCVGVCMWVL